MRTGLAVACTAVLAGACSGPRVTPAAGCERPLLAVTNRSRLAIAVAYHLSGLAGQRFLVVYYTYQDERAKAIDSLPPIGQATRFLGLVQPGRTERLGPVETLRMGEGPSVRISVISHVRPPGSARSVTGPYLPYLVCPEDRAGGDGHLGQHSGGNVRPAANHNPIGRKEGS